MTGRRRTAILISGRGSNMTSLIEAAKTKDYPAEIALVISNRPAAKGLATAAAHGIKTMVIDHKAFASRQAFDEALDKALRDHDIGLIACAGFMRVMGESLVARWQGRMLNIHPSLLPLYPGLNTHERALADGVRIHGCTVHFVRAKVDAGPIIAQGAVAVWPDDTPETLAARVLAVEHRIYPEALRLVASGEVKDDGQRAIWRKPFEHHGTLIVP
jgi:phosphoribosylglycinamide formyltransferase-1